MKRFILALFVLSTFILPATASAAPLDKCIDDQMAQAQNEGVWYICCPTGSTTPTIGSTTNVSNLQAGTGAPNGLTFPNLDPQAMAAAIDAYIAEKSPNSILKGQGANIVKSAQRNNINPFVVVAHAEVESGLGKPGDFNVDKGNNSFGRGATQSQPGFEGARRWYRWSSGAASVDVDAPENQAQNGLGNGGDYPSYLRNKFGAQLDANDLGYLASYAPPDENDTAAYMKKFQAIIDDLARKSGGTVTSSPTSSTPGSTSDDGCKSDTDTPSSGAAGPVTGECKELVERIRKLKDEKKLILLNEKPEMEDIEHCGQVEKCPSGGHIGVEKRTVSVLISLAEQSGHPVKVYALNKDHFCDQGEHGKGLGIDIPYNAGTTEGNAIYKFLYDNASTLGVHKLIYSPTPSGYECMYDGKPASCNGVYGSGTLSQHQDHIHVSLFP